MSATCQAHHSSGKKKLDNQQVASNPPTKLIKGTTQPLDPGTLLVNRYQIQDVIGIGGMGAVYRARDMHFPNVTKIVAVKEMVNQARDPVIRSAIVKNFEREANLLATLDHPCIPRIYDYFSHDECSYLILEFINGKNLEVLLRESSLSSEKVIQIAIELCDVLQYLHSHQPDPIIFRDMKPSNVMVNQYGHVVLIDFGIAKHFEAGRKGTMIGTEGYSPPEQYRGEAAPLADIYALGATLHHLLTRRDPRLEPPFSFSERPIRQSNPDVPPGLEEIIFKALQYNPEDRFPSAMAMREALLELVESNEGVSAASKASAAASKAHENTNLLWSFTTEDEIRGSAAYHNGILYFGSYDGCLYALDASKGKLIWKYPTDKGIVSKPFVLEDNVYVGSQDKRLHVVSLRSGRVNWTHYTDGPVHSSPTIAVGHVFIGSDDGSLHALSTLTGRPVWGFDAGSPIRSSPLVYQEYIYFGTEGGDFICLEFNGELKWHFNAKRSVTSTPTIINGVVYFGSLDSTLYALDAKSGWLVWRFKLDKGTISSPHINDDIVFIGAVDGCLYAIDTKSSKELWRFKTEHQVSGSPVTYRDKVAFGSVDGSLYCLDYQTGNLRWKFRTGGLITGTPVIGNKTIFIGSTDHNMYAINAEDEP